LSIINITITIVRKAKHKIIHKSEYLTKRIKQSVIKCKKIAQKDHQKYV